MIKNPFDSAKQDEVKDMIKNILIAFAANYPKSFIINTAKAIQEESKEDAVTDAPLLDEVPPNKIIKEGFLTKEGAVRKSWKKRWFTVDNEYTVRYYSKKPTKEGQKPKGEFSLFGYYVTWDSVKDHCIMLRPDVYDDHAKRTWRIACSSYSEYWDWRDMFEECVSETPNPMHENDVRKAAFGDTWMAMESGAGYWTPSEFKAFGNEGDMLAYHISKRVDREIMSSVYSEISGPNFAVRKMKNSIAATVGTMIKKACDPAWVAATEAVDKIAEPTEAKVRELSGPIFDKMGELQGKLQSGLEEKLDPILKKITGPLGEKVVPLLLGPIAATHKFLYKAFVTLAKDDKAEGSSFRGDFECEEFANAVEAADEFSEKLGELGLGDFKPDSEYKQIETRIVRECQKLLDRALYTYGQNKDLAKTAGFLLHDSQNVMKEQVTWFMECLLLPAWDAALTPVIEAVAGPLGELLPEAVKEFVDPVGIASEIGSNLISNQISDAVENEKTQGPLKEAAAEFGAAGVEVTEPSQDDIQAAIKRVTGKEAGSKHGELKKQESHVYVEPTDSDSEEEKAE